MSRTDLFGMACAPTLFGALGTAIDLSPLSRTKFGKDYVPRGLRR